jgi:antitoxin CcdA
MRMAKKHFEDPARPFRPGAEPQHSGHIGGRKSGPKRAVNVSVDVEILKIAKEMKLNLSQALEDALRRATEQERARRFYEENKAFFDLHNELAEKYGTLSEQLAREFGDDDQTI